MHKYLYKILFVIFTSTLLVACANRGTPSGGEKDKEPPKIVRSIPENFSINFNASEIKIYFDEYIKIKDVQRQLIISPPMDPQPDITPLGSASKYIKIKLLDTLQPNTTYAFNFGQSIVDNNEENPYSYYKYVFSTGDYIDSLAVKGQVFDALNRKPDAFVSVMLYEIDSTFSDSIVYKEKPKYIANTSDSITTFSLENLKAGHYLMVALKDENNNYTYQQKYDKIGFYNEFISVPTDSLYELKVFKEALDFKAYRPKQFAGQKIVFGYDGDYKDMQVEIIENTPKDYEYRLTKDKSTDSLYYWYKPKLELDSTLFVVSNKTYRDTLTHKFLTMDKDSLTIKALKSGTLNFNENFSIEGSVPFTNIDEKKITILDKDSAKVAFNTKFETLLNTYTFEFDKTESNVYKVQILPEALTDFYGNTNDTLNYSLRTKTYADYANMRVTLVNATYPVIVQLTDGKGVLKYELFADKPQVFDFKTIEPSDYFLRVIFDANGNQKWDSGNYLEKVQPERVSYFPRLIDEARANWDPVIEFILLED
ncbi:hypothetical protein A9Q87_09725 [Flavobacteriales bacterium 34_180_T64]|nr:hypothetical protein A9Q87_09725 [Flavobacteriales bacterium 34_180_T64]